MQDLSKYRVHKTVTVPGRDALTAPACYGGVQADDPASANIIGRKSESRDRLVTQPKGKRAGDTLQDQGGAQRFNKSSHVFGQLQDRRENEAIGKQASRVANGKASSSWKL